MTVQVNFRVRYKPHDLNYEVVTSTPGTKERFLFKTSRGKLEKLVRDLRNKENCVLKGNKGEKLLISKGKNNPVRKQISEYLELVLEGGMS